MSPILKPLLESEVNTDRVWGGPTRNSSVLFRHADANMSNDDARYNTWGPSSSSGPSSRPPANMRPYQLESRSPEDNDMGLNVGLCTHHAFHPQPMIRSLKFGNCFSRRHRLLHGERRLDGSWRSCSTSQTGVTEYGFGWCFCCECALKPRLHRRFATRTTVLYSRRPFSDGVHQFCSGMPHTTIVVWSDRS